MNESVKGRLAAVMELLEGEEKRIGRTKMARYYIVGRTCSC